MNLASISLRNLRIRALSSVLTTVSVALGAALVAALWLMIEQTEERYRQSYSGYSAIVGPKEGSPLTLVLNTVMNLGNPQGVVPMKVYRELHDGPLAKQLGTNYAIPQARGDFYRGFPLVGTTDAFFHEFVRRPPGGGAERTLQFAAGEPWAFGHEDFVRFAEEKARAVEASLLGEGDAHVHVHADGEEHDHAHDDHDHDHDHEHDHLPAGWTKAVIGAEVAARLGLGVGDTIVPAHGAHATAHEHQEAASEIVGILARTGTPIDNAIYVPISLYLSMEQHQAIRDSAVEISADEVLLTAIVYDAKHPLHAQKLRYEFQTRSEAQVAWPHIEIASLLQLVGNAADVLRVFAWLVVAVAALGVCVALYNTMNERRREIAIMRSLGARRWQILGIIVLEASVVSMTGAVAGVLLCHLAAAAFSGEVLERTSVAVAWADFSLAELWLILGITVLGAVAGVLPAVKGSTVEVAENLGPVS